MGERNRGTRAGKSRTLTAAGYTGDGRNMRAQTRGSGSRYPTLYYGDNGRILPCEHTLSWYDHYKPNSVGKYDWGS